tara:strand:+ start:536 stop:1660 length:1125 start_codon:yes stop_codon:yes gene_type:complete
MAEFTRSTGHAATPLRHDPKLFRDSVLNSVVGTMMGGEGSGAPIIVDTELSQKAGDTKRFHLTPYIDINPILGQDAAIKGNESKVTEAVFDVVIDEVNFALRKKGRMSDQRTILNVMNEHKLQITNLFMQYNNDEVFRKLSGQSVTDTDAINTDVPRVNGPNRCFRMDGTSGAKSCTEAQSDADGLHDLVAQTDKFNLLGIENIVAAVQAKPSNGYRLNSVGQAGRDDHEKYTLWVSPEQAIQLRQDPDWQNQHLSRLEAGLGDDFAEGWIGMYNNVIVRRTHRIRTFDKGSNRCARALLIGSDALMMCWANTLTFAADDDDYAREQGTNGWEVRGAEKITMSTDPDADPTGATQTQDLGIAQIISAAPSIPSA